jgi:molybdopterin-guanine dinucleotide biosynthesis protein A
MGQDKAFLPVDGQPSIERVLERTASLSDDLIVVSNAQTRYRQRLARFFLPTSSSSPSDSLSISGKSNFSDRIFISRMVSDIIPGKGSLGGIYTALHWARHSHCLVVACDMPFLNRDLLAHMMGLSPEYDAVVPIVNDRPEVLHAVYGKHCLSPIATRIKANRLKITDFLSDVRVRFVAADEVSRFDPQFRSFMNMNTPDDWQAVQRVAADERQE